MSAYPVLIACAERLRELRQPQAGEVLALLRRDWAVRVLDAWAKRGRRSVKLRHAPQHADWSVICGEAGEPAYNVPAVKGGSDPDAARLASAEAVWPELPESVRAELGGKP